MTMLEGEIWTWYGLSWLIVSPEFKKLQVEDLLVIVAMITDAILMVGMSIISQTSSNLIDPANTSFWTQQKSTTRIWFQMGLVVEQMQILTIWLIKYCLLLMYNRLTLVPRRIASDLCSNLAVVGMSLSQNLAVKFVAAYVTVGFVVMEILYLGVCVALSPVLGCSSREHSMLRCYKPSHHQRRPQHHLRRHDHPHPHANFPQIQLPLKRKAVLMVSSPSAPSQSSPPSSTNSSFNEPFGSNWTFWYIRESSTAIITANLPYIWTLLRRIFKARFFSGSTYGKSTNNPPKRTEQISPPPLRCALADPRRSHVASGG
ncbi:hypothetical protein FPOA_13651 [Fusarium poae]|uniref:Uncharacterized protein n=1 Tax=Fusarium poae TaxID=36050 RepID=A0A1B8A4X1_FUSPO|nr:hypothetical protein FPOA_13651 [Fusarium poae]